MSCTIIGVKKFYLLRILFGIPVSLLSADRTILEVQIQSTVLTFSRMASVSLGTDLGARQRYNCHMGLSPILNNGKEQLIIEIYWDGMECYYYWLLNLSDSIEVLYDSHRFPDCELGDIAAFADIDHDGVLEFIQRVDADIFAIFKYSKADKAFVFSNPKFSKFVDSYISGRINDLQVFLKSNNQQQDVDYHDELVSQITTIVIQYALSNQEQKGWAFFDKWYRQSDKQTIRNNIQQELANSELFKELHAH